MLLREEYIQKVISELKIKASPKRKELARTYYPTSMEVLGVIVPDVRQIIKRIVSELKGQPIKEIIQICFELVDTNIFECQQIAYELIGKNKKIMKEIDSEDIMKLGKNQDNWVSVDTYSGLILGVGWRLGKISDKIIFDKASSEDFWIRRQSLVATLGWNQKARGGAGNTDITLRVCVLFVDDHHDMINKALSWALRELSKTDKIAVNNFMVIHETRLAGRVKREVWNKLNTGLKNSNI